MREDVMASGAVVGLLASFFTILALGWLLRISGRIPPASSAVINRLIVDVTMPALLLGVLKGHQLPLVAMLPGVAVLALVLGALMVAAAGAGHVLGISRAAQGSAGMTAGFCNTGFMGTPIILGLMGERAGANSVVVDVTITTLVLWTVGVAWSMRFGHGGAYSRSHAMEMVRMPILWVLAVGVAVHAAGLEYPVWVERPMAQLGTATVPLVFLSLGIQLDITALKGRGAILVIIVLLKLVASPALAWAGMRVLGMDDTLTQVVVLQAGMPSALIGAVVATKHGCDPELASAAAVATSVFSALSLPVLATLLLGSP